MMKMYVVIGMMAAVMLLGAEEIVLTSVGDSPWSKNAESGEIGYQHRGKFSGIDFTFQGDAGSYYRLTLQGKCEGLAYSPVNLILRNGDSTQFSGVRVTPAWNPVSGCFFLKNTGETRLTFYLSEKNEACNIRLRDIKLEKLSEDDLKQNIIRYGSFEEIDKLSPDFMSGINDPASSAVETVEDAVSGKNAAVILVNDTSKQYVISSSPLPFVAGKKCKVAFWAKAEKKCTVNLTVDFAHKVAQRRNFDLDEQWRPYSFETVAPQLSVDPQLENRFCLINFMIPKPEKENKISIDDLSFVPVSDGI